MGNTHVESRILVLGIDNAGKTSFLNRFEHPNQDIPVEPTQAYTTRQIKFKGLKIVAWDISGKESTRSLWKHYYQEGSIPDAIIWVIDASSSNERLEESKTWLNNAIMDHALSGVLLCVLVNKTDLGNCKSVQELEKFLNLPDQENRRHYLIRPISALTGNGIKEAMEDLVKEIRSHKK